MYKLKPNSAWTEVSWIENGVETLFQARRSLQYSYAFAYYLFDSTSKNEKLLSGCRKFDGKQLKIAQTLFEDNQQELENSTEKLSGLLELPVDKLAWDENAKKEVIGVTVLVDRRLQALFDIIQSEFMNEDFLLPKPKSVISSGTKIKSSNFDSIASSSLSTKPAALIVSKKQKRSQQDEDLDIQRAIEDSLHYK